MSRAPCPRSPSWAGPLGQHAGCTPASASPHPLRERLQPSRSITLTGENASLHPSARHGVMASWVKSAARSSPPSQQRGAKSLGGELDPQPSRHRRWEPGVCQHSKNPKPFSPPLPPHCSALSSRLNHVQKLDTQLVPPG